VKIGLRIFLGYFLIVGLAGFFVMRVFVDEVKPGVRQAMEDTLVDTSNALAELAAADLRFDEPLNQYSLTASLQLPLSDYALRLPQLYAAAQHNAHNAVKHVPLGYRRFTSLLPRARLA